MTYFCNTKTKRGLPCIGSPFMFVQIFHFQKTRLMKKQTKSAQLPRRQHTE